MIKEILFYSTCTDKKYEKGDLRLWLNSVHVFLIFVHSYILYIQTRVSGFERVKLCQCNFVRARLHLLCFISNVYKQRFLGLVEFLKKISNGLVFLKNWLSNKKPDALENKSKLRNLIIQHKTSHFKNQADLFFIVFNIKICVTC